LGYDRSGLGARVENHHPEAKLRGTFFNSFRKGEVVCHGVDVDLSGKVAKKRLARKRGRHAHNAIAALYSLYAKVLAVANSRGMHTRTVTVKHTEQN